MHGKIVFRIFMFPKNRTVFSKRPPIMKTWLIDALRNVQKRIVSWLSIVTIVLIGTTLILGLFFGSSTVTQASRTYMESQNFKDFDVSCNMGIKEDEIAMLKEVDGIIDAEGLISFPAVAALNDSTSGITVVSATERISVPTVTEGALPSSENECAMSYSAMKKLGAAIGDEISINITSARFSEILKNKTYKITGVASHPDYMVNISTDYIVLSPSCFDTQNLSFDYSNILLDADIKADTFKKSYKETSTLIEEALKQKTDSLSVTRTATLGKELDQEYENARKTAADELAKGKSELDSNTRLFYDTIAEALEKLNVGEEELNNLKDMAEKELAEATGKLKEGEEEYRAKLADGQAQLEKAEQDMEKQLNDAKYQLFEGFLQLDQAEKLLNEKEEEYKQAREALEKGRVQLDEGIAKFEDALNTANDKADGVITSVKNAIDDAYPSADEEIREIYDDIKNRLEAVQDKDAITKCDELISLYNYVMGDVPQEVKDLIAALIGVDEFTDKLDQLKEGKAAVEDGQRKYDEGYEAIQEARKMLDQGWYDLQKGKEQLKEGQEELAKKEPEARQKLADSKKEFEEKKAEGARQLEEARATLASKTAEAKETIAKYEEEFSKAQEEYTTQKADGEEKLAEANEKYNEAEKEANEKLAEIQQQITTAKQTPCSYMVQTRDVNAPFVQTQSYIKAIAGFFGAFTPLYAGIIAIVCFFTMSIIVEEQTSQIGTCKAFGMYEAEIMRKYIVFGASGALFGAVAGVIGAFAIEKMLINTMKSTLAFSLEGTSHNIAMIVLLPVLEVLITVVAVIWSCHRYIRCSAVGLISGNEPAQRYRKKSGGSSSSNGGVYFKLIFNNLITDIGREIVSVVTIVMCVFIVGFGIDIKLAYEGALKRQMNNIWQYDISLTESGNATDEEKAAIKDVLSDFDTLYLPVTAGVIADGQSQILTSIICVDDKDEFARFFTLKDPAGKAVNVFDDGVLVTKEMEDKNSLSAGKDVYLVDSTLKYTRVSVKGIFMLYAGKTMIMTSDYYQNMLGITPVPNTYYIKAKGDAGKELKAVLSEMPGVSSVDFTRNLRDRNMAVVNLYNAVVAIVIIFSILLSFMILLNLSNILVAHRMRELLTMRVNGFSNSQVIGYLVREVLLTGVISITIGLALGVPLTGVIIKNLETDAFMFVREPFVLAWLSSVMINVLFSVTINLIAFRKVGKVPLTDINKY